MMKISRYNFIKKYDDNVIFFNSLTGALAIVDENFLKAYSDVENGNFCIDDISSELFKNMCESGAILDDEVDEIELVKYYRYLGKYNSNTLSLTIAPTLDCNFRCPYCFENHNHGIMNEKIQRALLDFIKLKISGMNSLQITWYGGEPLIAKKTIYSLSESIVTICKEMNVHYTAYMITNSSLLRTEDIEKFKYYNIEGAQITIDGPKEIHDSRRINITGESTFELMIHNVNMMLDNDLDVIVRINIDKENINTVNELLYILKERVARHERMKIDFGKVSQFTEVCKSIESSCFDNEQYADLLLPLYAKAFELGFTINRMNIYPRVRFNFCCADYVNSFVIDVDGYMYKCWNHVGCKEHSVLSLLDDAEKITASYLKWVNWNPMNWEKCRECNILPICMGGCPDEALNKNKGPVCDAIKYNLDRVLDYYYYNLKGENK